MELSLTITISAILGVSAIISPIIVALINNRHNYKIRKMELATDKKLELFELYIHCVYSLPFSHSPNDIRSYKHNYSRAILYVSSSSLSLMIRIDEMIKSEDFSSINKYIPQLSKLLQKDLGIYKR